jgi:phytoene/squalene synthetase
MLVDLIRNHPEQNSGLHAYITNMMAVMAFDAARRGRQISQQELTRYTRSLATAVTEALHYFIGNGTVGPQSRARYLAATAAHITHMLRDTLEDADAGYYNIPREFMTTQGMRPQDVESESYRAWVQRQVQFARTYFKAGRDYLMQVENLRCRIAGFAYMARFEGVLDAIEKEGYRVRFAYPEYKRLNARIRMIWLALRLALDHRRHPPVSHTLGTG